MSLESNIISHGVCDASFEDLRTEEVSVHFFCPTANTASKSRRIEIIIFAIYVLSLVKGGPGASGRVLPPVTGRSRVRVAVSSHCTGEGKACH